MSLDRDFQSLVFYKLLAKAFFKIAEHLQSWTPHSVERNKLEVIFVHSLLKASSFFPYGTVTRPFR